MRTPTSSILRLALVAACALIIPQGAIHAQQDVTRAVANIPFAFQLGAYHYAAGRYALELEGDHLLVVKGNANSGMMLVSWDTTNRPSATGKLVFHHYGSQYFLREMRIRGSSEFLGSAESKAEQRVRKEETVAANHRAAPGPKSNVEVALETPSR
jgi:hypothetical protein